ncbi:MAG: rubrerythrin [Candidatus Margulisiibacteriota bacterium]
MKSIKGSETERNLLKAFMGESQARNKYTYFSSVAKTEGLVQVAHIFEETSNQEREHAKRLFKFMEGGAVEVTVSFPAGVIGTTAQNLKVAAEGEHYEVVTMYPDFARIAHSEGFSEIAKAFESIAVAEKQHEKRYRRLLENVEKGEVFRKSGSQTWRCINCGYIHEASEEAPKACPACVHPQAYFEILAENW